MSPEAGCRVDVRPSGAGFKLRELPRASRRTSPGTVLKLPCRGAEMGVQASGQRCHVHDLPHPARQAPCWRVHDLPRDGHELGIQAPRQRGLLHQLPLPARRASLGCVHHLPFRPQLGVSPQLILALLLVPQGTRQPLRERLFLMPLSQQSVEKRHVPTPRDSRRRAYVSQFCLLELPSQWHLIANLRQVSRFGERAE